MTLPSPKASLPPSSEIEDLLAGAPLGYIALSADRSIAAANQTICLWTGLSETELLGTQFSELLTEASRELFERHIYPSLRSRGLVNTVRITLLSQDEPPLSLLVNAVERQMPDGTLVLTRLIFFKTSDDRYEVALLAARAATTSAYASAAEAHTAADLAQQGLQDRNDSLEVRIAQGLVSSRKTEEKLRQSQKMEAVGQLTGGIAHDFNNLLAGITGNMELLLIHLKKGRHDALPRYVEAALGAARRAATLTHRLLAFSRHQKLDPKPVDVNQLINGMEELIRRSVGPGVRLEVIGAGGLWMTIIDANQLENALLNLCLNARDAMASDGRLTIETNNTWFDDRGAAERDLPPGQYVSVSVTDTGTGMSAEVIARAFDPFYTTKPLGAGTGLGLSMVYGFARQSGGQVGIYSEVGQGTTMRIYLPRHHGEHIPISLPPVIVRPTESPRPETILVVDDEVTVRTFVAEVLQGEGYHTIEAADGAMALNILQSAVRIDVLVTDVGLPGGLNGPQVANAARVERPDLKVLFITGYAENALISNGHLEPGMQMLAKPFAIDDLCAKITLLMDQIAPSGEN